MAEVAEKARTCGMGHMHLPVFSEIRLNEPAIYEAASLIREEGTDLLREFEALAEHIDEPVVKDDGDDEIGVRAPADEAEEGIHLERGSCPVGNGYHGEA